MANKYNVLALIVLAASVLGFLALIRRPASPAPITVPLTEVSNTEDADTAPASANTPEPAAPVTSKLPIAPIATAKPKAPDYTKPLVFSASVDAQERDSLQTKFKAAVASLEKNSADLETWSVLGVLRHAAGDEKGAEEVWLYTTKAWPNDFTPFDNLGNLYMSYLKDYPKAESNYLMAIKNNATDLNAYRSLFELYTQTSYKPTNTAAEDILKKGIVNNARAIDLQVLLARYYKDQGRTAEAKATYEAAAAAAKKQGNTQLVSQIEAEASELQ